MNPVPAPARIEGALILIAIALALLVYGYFNEEMFSLGGGSLPAVAILAVLLLSIWDAVRQTDRGLRESLESPLALGDALVGVTMCSLYAVGIVYIGLTVSTFVMLVIATGYLNGSFALKDILTGALTALAIWFTFAYLGGAYFGESWLF